jgi:hypothetical protein
MRNQTYSMFSTNRMVGTLYFGTPGLSMVLLLPTKLGGMLYKTTLKRWVAPPSERSELGGGDRSVPCPRLRGHVYGVLTTLLWLGIYGSLTAHAAESLELQIDALALEALNAPTVQAAQEKITEAEQLLKNNQTKIKKITYRFLLTNLDLTNGRIKAAAWQLKKDDEPLRQQARQILTRVLPLQESLKTDTEKTAGELETKLEEKADQDPWLQQLWAYSTRIEYNIAWTRYSLALVTDQENPKQKLLQKAIEGFQPFTQDSYQNHPVIAECFLGQALCLFEQKKFYDVIRFLDLNTITPDNTPAETYKRISFLRIQSGRQLPSDLNTIWAAEQFFNSLVADDRLDKTELDMALDWARSLTQLAQSPENRKYLHSLLLRLERVASLVYPYGDPFSADLAQIIRDLPLDTPYASVVLGRKQFQEKKYPEALQYAQTGIRNLTEKESAKLSADLYFLQNTAAWNGQNYLPAYQAARFFLQQHTKDDRADQVLQRGIQAALNSLNSDEAVDLEQFIQFLDFTQLHWPDHPEVKKAPWYRGWVFLETQRYPEARRMLQNVPPDSDVYPQALYGLALASLNQAQNQKKLNTPQTPTLRQHLLDAADSMQRFVKIAPKNPSPQQKELQSGIVEVGAATAQAFLNLSPSDPNIALNLIDTLEKLPDVIKTREPGALLMRFSSPRNHNSEEHKKLERRLALRLQAYAELDNIKSLLEVLDILIKFKNHSDFSLHALIRAGNTLENVAPQPTRSAESKRIIYDKLVSLYQYLLTQAQQKKHLLITEPIVRRRLAQSLAYSGRRLDAVQQYLWILKHEPSQKTGDVRRSLALVYEELDQFETAIEQWRILAQGLAPDSEPYLEANYRLILAHLNAQNTQQAKKLIALFLLRHPNIEPKPWRLRFQQLDQKLKANLKSNKGPENG